MIALGPNRVLGQARLRSTCDSLTCFVAPLEFLVIGWGRGLREDGGFGGGVINTLRVLCSPSHNDPQDRI